MNKCTTCSTCPIPITDIEEIEHGICSPCRKPEKELPPFEALSELELVSWSMELEHIIRKHLSYINAIEVHRSSLYPKLKGIDLMPYIVVWLPDIHNTEMDRVCLEWRKRAPNRVQNYIGIKFPKEYIYYLEDVNS